ncbi:MAG TPA: MupA/Atu3671 family FMN-dependent luciferase-like monooxygenase [Candidatus Solibacter sp.]|jgi:natural product biosynthesis luciferase-like monooxygenase protein|nr:MupA/Atu3671 family FMN-dependent luciferase-like monooxygenase [Candidatus Solibacter sp.]
MSNLSDRIKNLTPEQQELLRRRMQRQPDPAGMAVSSPAAPAATAERQRARRKVDFSIFFFSADGTTREEDRYRLLIESTRFADRNGFSAVWTPERHFQAFGGLYPNPAVLSAALAMITERVQIRAGSVVLPLHSPVRVAEDWALVDNLSRGRVAISFATGWHEHDYVIAPANYEDRRELMFRDIQVVRRLWAGEEVDLAGVHGKITAVKTFPRPIQPQLPFWVTVSSPRTWHRAGEIGANVLTALGGLSLETLSQSIAAYRKARLENGHDPRTGIVSLMLHTYIGTDMDAIRDMVREPLKNYLQGYLAQFQPMVGDGVTDVSSREMQDLLELAFENYFQNASLMGTPAKCAAMVEKISLAGVNEAACLIDFGVDFDSTMLSLDHLAGLRRSLDTETVAAVEGAREQTVS